MVKLQAGSEEAGVRLDRILRKRLVLMTLSDIYALIRKGGVRVNGRKVKQDYRLCEGDQVDIAVDSSELVTPKDTSGPEALRKLVNTDFFSRNFQVIFEDPDLLACNKPAGLVVHPGTGHVSRDTLIDLASAYLVSGGSLKEGDEPALVHRLDRDTSGVILIAKSKRVVRALHEIFRAREIYKEYTAVCHHRPPDFEGEIVTGLTRTSGVDKGMKMKVSGDDEALYAKTRYRIVVFENDLSRMEVVLETGKTHQIRVHMAHVKAPIVGDERYGDHVLDRRLFSDFNVARRLYLHARHLSFPHPVTGRKVTIKAPDPAEFAEIFVKVGSSR